MKRLKYITVVIIALIMLLSVFMSACVPNCNLSFLENQQGSNNSSAGRDEQNNGNNNGNNNSNNNNGNNTNKPDYSQYSPILQAVLTDPYYDEDAIELPYPFHTLESQGYPYERIKERNDISRFLYIKNGDKTTLYFSLQLYFDDETLGCLLSYKITEEEYDELMMLSRGKYKQAHYWIQELDKQRKPTIVSSMKYTPGTVESFESTYVNKALGATRFDTWRVHLFNIENVTGVIYKLNLILISTNKQKILYRTIGTDSNSGARFINNTFNIRTASETSDITDEATLAIEESISITNTLDFGNYNQSLK